jgi:siderophore synthetase component
MEENSSTPATKQDIEHVLQQLGATEARLADRLERAVTTLLTGFHSHARRSNVRDTALETRVAQIEERLLDIEQQIGLPPDAPRQ